MRKIADRLEALLREKGAKNWSYQVSESEKQELNTEKTDFNLFRTTFDHHVAVTVLQDGRKGSAAGNDLSEAGLARVVEDALTGAEGAQADEANVLAERQEPAEMRSGSWEGPDMPRFYDSLRQLMATVEKEYPQVSLMTVIGDHVKTHTLYANSNGTRFERRHGVYEMEMEMSGTDGTRNTGLDYTGLMTHDLDTPLADQGSVRQHLRDTEAGLRMVTLPGKFEGTVIFTPDCLGSFLRMLAGNYLMSSVIMEGTSQWLDKLDQPVASPLVTVSLKAKDDRIATEPFYTGDGYRAEDVTVLERGVLKSFLLNLYAARKTGRAVTKNDSLALVMEPGETPLAEMIASVRRGLIVGGFSGGYPGANGEFSGVAKNSFYVEDGRIAGAVTETMINGNLEKVFRQVRAISREQVRDGGSVLPYLASDGIVISGK